MDQYSQLISRNWAFIDKELQFKLKDVVLCFIGCGLGSNIAALSVRLGFEKFILVDFDEVEISNLNRQPFTLEHISQKKTDAIEDYIKKINPKANVVKYTKKVTTSDIEEITNKADYIINTIDVDEVYYCITDLAREKNKKVFLPFNIGFGGILFFFDNKSPYLKEMTGNKIINSEQEFYRSLYKNLDKKNLPSYIREVAPKILSEISSGKPNPQLCIASNIISALVITAIVRLEGDLPVDRSPKPIICDANNLLYNSDSWL